MTSTDRAATTLTTLPEDLCLDIVEHLDMASVFALVQTNRFFHRLAEPHNLTQPWLLDDFLCEQQWADRWFRDGYACFTCKKVLDVSHFDFCQTDGDRDKEEGMDEELRFCLPCGVGQGEYPPGREIYLGRRVRWFCAGCKKLREGNVGSMAARSVMGNLTIRFTAG
ncbi:unnamed protein product [Zymoseptoria tritici ST99CH_1A5]|uniref:F-box domain-containing protein n=1 Tax=Zymoseptoria tritici ST99CH_1A5 TaxID=1276529 RepID=A0A1Y6LNE9_ZYMTR|nr:unnamed protein product [Zymoseptoria tritici ST99CH_1A5]